MAKIIAINAVEKIISDLTDRRGIGREFEECDEEIQAEIKEAWENIIVEEIKKSSEIKTDREQQIKELNIWKNNCIADFIKAVEGVFDKELRKLG